MWVGVFSAMVSLPLFRKVRALASVPLAIKEKRGLVILAIVHSIAKMGVGGIEVVFKGNSPKL